MNRLKRPAANRIKLILQRFVEFTQLHRGLEEGSGCGVVHDDTVGREDEGKEGRVCGWGEEGEGGGGEGGEGGVGL